MSFSWCKLVCSVSFWIEIIIRIGLFILNRYLYYLPPFERLITKDELPLYAFPPTASYVPINYIWVIVFGIPPMVIFATYIFKRNDSDLWNSFLTVSLTFGLSANVIDLVKTIVGRPRPDFLYRCFEDVQLKEIVKLLSENDVVLTNFNCTGNPTSILDGRKSFPSAHASFAFATFGFVAFYLAGKFHTFDSSSQRHGWKLCLFWLLLGSSTTIAASRTCDYHHHWQDVTVGSLIGLCFAHTCYRFYYPALNSHLCHKPYSTFTDHEMIEKKLSNHLDV